MYELVIFNIFHRVVQPSPLCNFRMFHHPQSTCIHEKLFPTSCYSQPFLSISRDLLILDILYKWNHTVCSLLRLASFTYHNVSSICLCCSMHLFLFMPELSTVCVCHILFIHLSVDGHLSCFYVLAIIN